MKLHAKKLEFENFLMFEDLTLNLSYFVGICHKTKHQQKNLQTFHKLSSTFHLLGVLEKQNVWLQQMIIFFYAKDFTFSCINTMFFLLLGVGP
jgi:hypothetical protein